MSKRKVPVAYVTKYAGTRGVVVVRDAYTDEDGRYLVKRLLVISPNDWTEDKSIAEELHRADLKRELNSFEEKVNRIQAALDAPPKYEEGT